MICSQTWLCSSKGLNGIQALLVAGSSPATAKTDLEAIRCYSSSAVFQNGVGGLLSNHMQYDEYILDAHLLPIN